MMDLGRRNRQEGHATARENLKGLGMADQKLDRKETNPNGDSGNGSLHNHAGRNEQGDFFP
jgi:hypothetical protein